MHLNQKFSNVVSFSLTKVSFEDLKDIALGIWYENYTPNLNGMNVFELQRSCYLIDRLMRYNCVPKTRKVELMGLIKIIQQELLTQPQNISASINIDPLAKKWNLNEDISRWIPDLLEYQTRHYVHS